MDESDGHDGHDQHFGPGAPMDLAFDFEGYFERSVNGQLSQEEGADFAMRAMGLFCRDFWKKEDPADVPVWLMKYFANQFFKVLAGERWNDAFPLPWHLSDPVRSRTEEQELQIFCAVANLLRDDPGIKITSAVQEVADARHVSYETARAAWYKLRKHMPQSFLKNDSKS